MTHSQKITISVLVVLAIAFVMAFAFTMVPNDITYADDGLEIVSVGGNPVTNDTIAGSFPMGRVGVAYSATLVAEGGTAPYTWSVLIGSLPEGITLDADTGVVSGTPTGTMVGTVTIRVADSTDKSDSAQLNFLVRGDNWEPTIETDSLPNGVLNEEYSSTIIDCDFDSGANTFAVTWSVVDGSLPTGLILGKQGSWDGLLSGTPTATGTFNFTLKAENYFGSDTQEYTIVVDDGFELSYETGKYYLGDTIQINVVGMNNANCDWTVQDNTSANTTISSTGLLTIGNDETSSSVYVRATSKTNDTNSATKTVYFTNKTAYTITVNNGKSVDSESKTISRAAQDETVYINADDIAGKQFREWTYETSSTPVTFWRTDIANSSFEMPNGNVEITANYNIVISKVSADFDMPVDGQHVDKTLTPGGAGYTATLDRLMYNSGYISIDDTTYVAGRDYVYFITFAAEEGYELVSNNSLFVTINGVDLDYGSDYTNSSWRPIFKASAVPYISNIQLSSAGVLTWDAFTGAEDYEINIYYSRGSLQRCSNGETTYNIVNGLKEAHEPSNRISYDICAIDSEGNEISGKSQGAFDYISEQTRLDTPSNVRWEHATATWDAVVGANSYRIDFLKTDDDSYVTGETVYGKTYYTSQIFETDISYYFTVYAIPNIGDLDHSISETAKSSNKTFEKIAASLTNVTITDDGMLSFDALGGDSYIYEIDVDATGGVYDSLPINLYRLVYDLPENNYDIRISVYSEYYEPLVPEYVYNNWAYNPENNPYKTISGKPVINGTAKYGETLSVDTSSLTYVGNLKYTWFVKNAFEEWNIIPGAVDLTVNTYTISGYINLNLRVRVESDESMGYVESDETSAILPSDASLTGTVRIEGTKEYDSILSAYLDDSNNTNVIYLNYQWKRNGVNIVGAVSRDYYITADDVGNTLSVVITSDCFQGSRTSAETTTIEKGQKASPAGLTSTNCTTYENNNGTINNVTTEMEYKLSTAENWTAVTGAVIENLVPGTYYVRYKESTYMYASKYTSINVASAPTNSISVSGGVAKIGNNIVDEATVGATITIVANEPANGYVFDYWRERYSHVTTFGDIHSTTTTFVMIDDNVYIIAEYTGAVLTGDVSISGTKKYQSTLTASVTNSNNTGSLSYQWMRNGSEVIVGATSSTYTLAEDDIGHTISVVVTSSIQTNSIQSSPTNEIAKADGGNAPYCYITNCTTYENNDGTFTDVDTTMEYKLSTDEAWTPIAGTTVENLVAGTYYIRYKESATHMPSASRTLTIAPARLFDISVTYGVAKFNDVEITQAAKGATIAIVADAPSTGFVFDEWQDTYHSVILADSNASTTTFVMIENNIYLVAKYTGAPLSGTVSITGTPRFDSILNINLNTNGTHTFLYQWTRDGVDISGATSDWYRVAEEDIGHQIRVRFSTNMQTGSLTSDPVTCLKKEGPGMPTVSVYGCTTSDNNDGIISGTTSYMEYKYGDGAWQDVINTSIEGLVPGTYYIRYKESTIDEPGETRTVVVNGYDAPVQYSVSITNGTADPASAVEGAVINITANAPAANYEFDKWVSEDVEFDDETATTTTFEMPGKNVTISATYKLVKHAVSFNANEGGTGSKAAEQVEHGALFTLPDNPFTPIVGKGFTGWAYASDGDVINGTQILINADTELFAIWHDVHVHSMTFHAEQAATCTQAGNIAYYECTSCHNLYTDELGEHQVYEQDVTIAALGHDYQATVIPPTCTEAGYTTHVCSRCGNHYEDTEVAALGHNEVIDPAVPATCTETGLSQGKHCSRCNEVLIDQEVIPALGHEWGEWTVTTPAQIGVEGVETRVCAHDTNHKETRPIPALPYEYREEGGVKIYETTITANVAKDVKSLFDQAKAGNGKVEISVGTMKITFNENAVNTIGGNTASLTANVLTTGLDIEGAQLVIEVSLTGATFANGKATIVVPFSTAVPEGKVAKVYYVNGTEKTDMNATFADGKASFDTNHFSKFAIVFENANQPQPQPVNPDQPAVQPAKKGLSGGAIAGIVIAIVVALGAAGFCVYWFVLRNKKGNAPKVEEKKEDESQEETKEEPQEEEKVEEQPEETPEEENKDE